MSKDTNSFGHDKALACESRGFVYKKRGCIVLTHPHLIMYIARLALLCCAKFGGGSEVKTKVLGLSFCTSLALH